MNTEQPLATRAARLVHRTLAVADPRALVAAVTITGLLAWLLPWQGLLWFFALACILAVAACRTMPGGRQTLGAYGIFVLLWVLSSFFLRLFDQPDAVGSAMKEALLLGARLFTLLGLAMAVPMAATPLTLGRTLAWYLHWPARAEAYVCSLWPGGGLKPKIFTGVWRAALALALMMAFFPRLLRMLAALRRSLQLRAPRLALHRRFALLGLAVLRVCSAQTWDMALAIASRDLYRPEPWTLQVGRDIQRRDGL